MRLTENMVIARSKQSDLSAIKRINLWGCDLTDISIVKFMPNLEILALSINNLSGLRPLETCMKLQMLYLRKNNISDFAELKYLQQLPNLSELCLAENPCAISAGANYRATVLNMLPRLKKLDDVEVTASDIEESMKLNCAKVERECFPYEVCLPEVVPNNVPEVVPLMKTESPMLPQDNNTLLPQQPQPPAEMPAFIKQQDIPQAEPQLVPQDFRMQHSRHSLPLSYASCGPMEQPADAQLISKAQSMNQIPQLKLVLQIQHPPQGIEQSIPNMQCTVPETVRNRYDSWSDRVGVGCRNVNRVRLDRGSFTSRTRVSQGMHQDSGWESSRPNNYQSNFNTQAGCLSNRSMSINENMRQWENGYQTNRSNASRTDASPSTQYSTRSSQRNANVRSALMCMLPELDFESLQVLEHSIQCRLDELCEQ